MICHFQLQASVPKAAPATTAEISCSCRSGTCRPSPASSVCHQGTYPRSPAREELPLVLIQYQEGSYLQGSCYGCGLPLQTAQPGVAGYVAADKAAPTVQHKHNKRILCERCQDLSNGRMIPAVEDFSSRQLSGSRLYTTSALVPCKLLSLPLPALCDLVSSCEPTEHACWVGRRQQFS